MAQNNPHALGLTAWLAAVCLALLMTAGAVWHGVTAENFLRLWRNLADRPSGQMSFRFVLQPAMASFFAIRHGLADARSGRSPYFWTILWDRRQRAARLREGLNATAKVILIALIIDAIYQALELGTFYPAEAPIVALLLAFVPYLLVRGMTVRAVRWRSGDVVAPNGPPTFTASHHEK
jgi:hypothetical protein